MMPLPARGAVLIRARLLSVLAGLAGVLGGCVTTPSPLAEPPPYMLLPADEMASCDAIAASFQFSARRAARLEYWLARGPVFGYGFERFPLDAPKELVDERRRLDALSDLQREKGCFVMEPGPTVVYERSKLEGSVNVPQEPVILRSRG
jgi:hypothetical protein